MTDDIREVARGLRFPEGPIAMSDGTVLVVEIGRGTLSRVTPDGVVTVVSECGGGPNGAAIGPDGAAYICNNGGFSWREHEGLLFAAGTASDYTGGHIQRIELESGKAETLYTDCDGTPFAGPNDIVFDAFEGFYFTDFGQMRRRTMTMGGVYYAKADGTEVRVIAVPMFTPYGVGLSPNGDRLYVAETITSRVWYWEIESPGVVRSAEATFGGSGATLLCGLPGYQVLDSLAVDSAGNVCVGTLVNSGITVVTPDGEVDFVPIPGDILITNICFGGPGLRTAWITASTTGRLLAMSWPRPGLELPY